MPDIASMAPRWKLTWLPAAGAELVPLTLVDFGYLVTKRKLEDEDVFQDFVNEHTVHGAGACCGCNTSWSSWLHFGLQSA